MHVHPPQMRMHRTIPRSALGHFKTHKTQKTNKKPSPNPPNGSTQKFQPTNEKPKRQHPPEYNPVRFCIELAHFHDSAHARGRTAAAGSRT